MVLLDRQRRMVELGRIRLGARIARQTQSGGTRLVPVKLDTFRLTSPDRAKLEAVAGLYGGDVREWQSPTGPQWEVTTTVDRMPIALPPGEPVSQFYEMWPSGNCTRRCDGRREQFTGSNCLCPPDLEARKQLAGLDPPQACKPRTRLSLILADIPGIGIWVLTSTGDQAADELAGVADMLHRAAVKGVILPAVLRLDKRETKNRGTVKKYVVPVLDVQESFAALAAGKYDRDALGATPARPALEAAGRPDVATAEPPEALTSNRAQGIADEIIDPAATLKDLDEYEQIVIAEDLLEHVVHVGTQSGTLRDLFVVRRSALKRAAGSPA